MNQSGPTGTSAEYSTLESRVYDPPLELYTSPQAFQPNPTTVRFARAMDVNPGDVVFDIGTGIGPLAISAALKGASVVHAVDPVPLHCELARKNVAKYNLQDKVHVHQGGFFEPFERDAKLKNLRANVLLADVSGIAEGVSHALGWYSSEVPTGGYDGTRVLIRVLEEAGEYLADDGRVFFPVAVDLSDGDKVRRAAEAKFEVVENALRREFVEFPLSDEEVQAIDDAYEGNPPSFIKVQQGRRPHWRGQIWVARRPKR